MQIGGGPVGSPEDIPAALRAAATRLGHRPAITVLRADRRDEQGFASLHRWTAKGAHLLQLEVLLQPGDRVRIASPPDWPVLTACLAAWWLGGLVTDARPAEVSVADVDRTEVDADYALGTLPDGRPRTGGRPEPWVDAVQTFPDDPPAPAAGAGDLPAVDLAGERWTQAELIARARSWGEDGVLGVRVGSPAEVWIPAVVRPLLTGRPTVVIDGAEPDAIEAENVAEVAGPD